MKFFEISSGIFINLNHVSMFITGVNKNDEPVIEFEYTSGRESTTVIYQDFEKRDADIERLKNEIL